MKQFLLPPGYTGQSRLRISGSDYHYLKHVLRFQEGDSLYGRDRNGDAYRLTVEKEDRDELVLGVRKELDNTTVSCRITLFQCLPRVNVMDRIVRQMVESGVTRVTPLYSEKSVVHPDNSDRMSRRMSRWQRIAKEALQQSGLHTLPEITEPMPLTAITEDDRPRRLVCHTEPAVGTSLHGHLRDKPRDIDILIGPESGLTEEEMDWLRGRGFHRIYLGQSVLRVDTAAVSAVSAVKVLLEEKDDWEAR